MTDATIITARQGERVQATLSGEWTLATLPTPIAALEARLRALTESQASWDLQGILRLDSVAALLLWRSWGQRWPDALAAGAAQRSVLARVADIHRDRRAAPRRPHFVWLYDLGRLVLRARKNLVDIVALIGQLLLDVGYLFAHPRDFPWREFSATLYKSGAQALPVTALVGFLIGIVLSFLSSLQLKAFGADIYIVNLLGVSIIRELGPVIVAVLVAGRSGSAMTAQIGVMRVKSSVDAAT